MLLPGTISPRTWLLFTVIISLIILNETSANSRLDINFGFDLKQGNDGDLHIRNLEDSRDINRRADDDSDESDKKPKESSESDSHDDAPKKHGAEKPIHKNSDNSDSESSDENDSNDKLRSTRGLRPEEFEPEDNPKLHAKYKDADEEEGSEGSSRRRKRSIQLFAVKEPEILAH